MKIKNKVSAKLLGSAMLSAVLLCSNCKKEEQDFVPNAPVSSDEGLEASLEKLATVRPLSVTSSSVASNAYRIENALPKGYVKDGSKDYTSYVQAAINKYSVLAFPGFPIQINAEGLEIPSNRKIYFINGSELRLKPTSEQTYYILNLRRVSNVTLVSPVIKGDKNSHRGTSGEWGMGIGIRGCSNITIESAEVYDCWGDGIYIDDYNGTPSEDIEISKVICKNNRRDGMSVCSVDGLLVERSYFGYSSGHSPEVGINFEGEGPEAELKNITVQNVTTEYNAGYGIQIGMSKMYGGKDKNVSFNFTNFMDKGSRTGFKAGLSFARRKGHESISGTIKLNVPFWRYNSLRAMKTALDNDDVKIIITHPKVTTMSGKYLGADAAESYLLSTKGIINPTAQDNKLVKFN